MKQKLELEQKQILKLSQEMKLSFQILSMSNDELMKYWKGKVEGNYQSTEDSYFENLSKEEDFYVHLENQLLYLDIPQKFQDYLVFCIHNLNSSGFLEMNDVELCSQLKISPKILEKLYEYLYSLQPTGVGTRNFKEAIRLQLQKKKKWQEVMWEVLNRLDYVASGRLAELACKLNLSEREVEEIVKEIRACNPKPARGFLFRKTFGISPDFFLEVQGEECLLTENTELQKNLYRIDMKEDTGLQLLRQCIEKRIQTLRRILEYLVSYQKDYFLGKAPLHTLHVKDVGEQLGFHTSTVSRAIQNKYLKTEKGIFSVKSLFCYSEERNQIKMAIQQLIEEENKEKPYSDAEIQEYLEREFLWRISRRTVAKYREELGYLSSLQRKWK